jgi:hypothetical protein
VLRQTFGMGALVAAVISASTPAHATATLECVGIDDPEVYVRLTLGSVPVLAVVNALIETPGSSYAFFPEGDQKEVVLGQGMATQDSLALDLIDPNALAVEVSLRTLQAHRDEQSAHVGILVAADSAIYTVSCDS